MTAITIISGHTSRHYCRSQTARRHEYASFGATAAGANHVSPPDFDENATISPPADGCLGRRYANSNGDFNLSTFGRLARFAFRRFSDADIHKSREIGYGAITNQRLPPTPPKETLAGQPGNRRPREERSPRAYATSRIRHTRNIS